MGSIQRTPQGRWKVQYRDASGKQRYKTFDRKTDAQRYLVSIESEVIQGTWRDPKLEKIKYEDWIGEWWATTFNLRPSTRSRDERYLRKHVLSHFGEIELGRITPVEIRRWVAVMATKNLAPATIRKAYQILSKSLKEAVAAGLIVQSPCRGISLPKVEPEEMRYLSAPQVLQLADVINPRYRALVILAAYSGLRWAELIGLRSEHLNLERGFIQVTEILVELDGATFLPPSPPKTRAGRRKVPIPPSVIEELRQHVEIYCKPSFDHVFQAPEGGPIRNSFRDRVWIPAITTAGVSPLRFHDLRHTAIALWIAAGASPKQIAVWAGHTSTSVVLDRYGHLFPEADEKLVAALEITFRQAKKSIPGDDETSGGD